MAKRLVAENGDQTSKKIKLETKQVELNSNYFDRNAQLFSQLQSAWKNQGQCSVTDSVQLFSEPYLCCMLQDFIKETSFNNTVLEIEAIDSDLSKKEYGYLRELKNALMKLKFFDKNNDLYQFKQSHDLKDAKSQYITQFRDLLYNDVLPWLRELTGIELSECIDMTCSKYEYADTLLCHDDELEGRRIAFIYYLTDPSWSREDGGTLDLYNTDDHGQPSNIAQSIIPQWNSFVFFEVNPISFHQVSEILSADKVRLSINGWFHGPPVPRSSPYKETLPTASHPVDLPLEVLCEWVNPLYLDVGIQTQIREHFENESQIELPDFLLEDKYKSLCEVLDTTISDSWERQGPPNKRSIHSAQRDNLSSLASDFLTFLLSDPFCLALSHFTGLQLSSHNLKLDPEHENESDTESDSTDNPTPCCCYGNWYRWQPGDYTLVRDTDVTSDFLLELRLYFGSDGWRQEYGGYTSYIANGEDEELLTVTPQSNSLTLVYKDSDTLSFTKYINHRADVPSDSTWYTIMTVYKENTVDD